MRSETSAGPEQQTGQVAKEQASRTAGEARSATADVASTARDQVRHVAAESRSQARAVAEDMRGRIADEAEEQTQRLCQGLRQWSRDLGSMADNADTGSPARGAVHRLAERGDAAADYLERNGAQGVLDDVQSFARRRPALFLAGAAAAGFAVGRLVKSARAADSGDAAGGPEAESRPQAETAHEPRGIPEQQTGVPPQYREVR
ncbi:hypothetical protein ACFPZ0_00420 [Streptomonospora nanhaiensis]|uniref:Poly-gamma-glutamate capsule biosynthesis protein CapA/YwtB (Metallophosphatase superfamily) n=1 Tax=Streptomonospora nanhaiensis TaxID=1323731 RepID=A0A853BJG6_9ACTN|nr:hypothetical protein [Streptomonospora nanhaiensis]MBV2364215.1 hypothetical protein [Streptomonospora nanhaiensis]MBX9386665.1 hypothetical protein [Streptomonospora nanhaiensis]NYI95170.1 poly-gamma-glutamate capsule biosynthesis protein CapA/YwtB (metallophosphatase superfamily) [Streptomonospora nanhaiensis]